MADGKLFDKELFYSLCEKYGVKLMTKEQIEKIAKKCGVEVSYTEHGKGGFILDSSEAICEPVNGMLKEPNGTVRPLTDEDVLNILEVGR